MTSDIEGIAELFFDRVAEVKIANDVVRIALEVRRGDRSEIVGRLAIPLSELPDVIQFLVIGLAEATKQIIKPLISGAH